MGQVASEEEDDKTLVFTPKGQPGSATARGVYTTIVNNVQVTKKVQPSWFRYQLAALRWAAMVSGPVAVFKAVGVYAESPFWSSVFAGYAMLAVMVFAADLAYNPGSK